MAVTPANLPGEDLVTSGLSDLAAGRVTESALLVAMAAPRLRSLGLDVPRYAGEQPSHRLYALLADAGGDAHSRYKALVRRIVSFAHAAERAAASP